jgi:hypothetical protein
VSACFHGANVTESEIMFSRRIATSTAAIMAVVHCAQPALAQTTPRRACFVELPNSFTASAGSPSLASAEASTAQVLEVLAERRESCPTGSVRTNGSCGPSQVVAVALQPIAAPATPVQAPAVTTPAPVATALPAPKKQAPVAATVTVVSQPSQSVPNAPATPIVAGPPTTPPITMAQPAPVAIIPPITKSARPATTPVETAEPTAVAKSAGRAKLIKDAAPAKTKAAVPRAEAATASNARAAPSAQPSERDVVSDPIRRQGAWSEAFAERERRPGSSQSTAGVVVGFDREFSRDGMIVRLGGIGSLTDSRRTLNQETVGSASREVTFTDPSNTNSPSTLTFDIENRSSVNARLRTSGVGGGFTWSFAGNGAFLDGVAKVDLFDFNRASTVVDNGGALSVSSGNTQIIFNGYIDGSANAKVYDQTGRIIYEDTPANIESDTDARARFNSAAVGCMTLNGTNTTATIAQRIAQQVATYATAPQRTTQTSGSASLAVMTFASTLGHSRDLGDGWRLEPSIGLRYTYSNIYNADATLGLRDGQVLRVEAGGKIVHVRPIGHGRTWTNAAGLYAYSDVAVDGFVTTADGTSFKGDEGLPRVRGFLQSKMQFADGFQLYGELNGRFGQDLSAVGGKVGLRVEW